MPKIDIRRNSLLFLLSCALLASCASIATASEAALNSRWRGAWVLLDVDTFSGCGGNFTNNELRGLRVQSKGAYRFQTGELGSVYKVNLNRKQVEVLIELAEPMLVPRQDGPFTLYEELSCKVELQIKLLRGTSNRDDEVERLIAGVLDRHETHASAQNSEGWNGRLRDEYPEDYDDTLYEYELWRAEQINSEVAAKIDRAIEEAARLVDRLDDNPDYLTGFAEGVDRARDHSFGDNCDRLLSKTVHSFVHQASKGDDRARRDGYKDGQELVFYLEIGRRLRFCYVPPPS